MSTSQETFDMVVNHLRQQNSKSVELDEKGTIKTQWDGANNNPICLYRSKDGKKCAAGAAITDEEYNPGMEGKNIGAVISLFNLERLKAYEYLLLDLQRVHDAREVGEWETGFKGVAEKHSLTYIPPTENK